MLVGLLQVLDLKPHGRPTDVYSLGCCFLELTVDVPTKETLQEKVCMMNLMINWQWILLIPFFFASDFKFSVE